MMMDSYHSIFSKEHLEESSTTKTKLKDRQKFERSFSLRNRFRSAKWGHGSSTLDQNNKLNISDIVSKMIEIDLSNGDHASADTSTTSRKDKQNWFARSFSLRKPNKLRPGKNDHDFPLLNGKSKLEIMERSKERTKTLDMNHEFTIPSEDESLGSTDHLKASFKSKTQRMMRFLSFKKSDKTRVSDDSCNSLTEEPIYVNVYYVKKNEQPKAIRAMRNTTKIFLKRLSPPRLSRPSVLETSL